MCVFYRAHTREGARSFAWWCFFPYFMMFNYFTSVILVISLSK